MRRGYEKIHNSLVAHYAANVTAEIDVFGSRYCRQVTEALIKIVKFIYDVLTTRAYHMSG